MSAPSSTLASEPMAAAASSDRIPINWNRLYFWMYLTYFAIGAAARLVGWWNGDGILTVIASRNILVGSFDIYHFLWGQSYAPPDGFGYAYSPLVAIFVAPVVWLGDSINPDGNESYRAVGIPLMLMDILAMDQLRRLAKAWRPALDERMLFLGIALSLFVTSFWIATAWKGHVEGMVLFFLLLTIRFLPRNLLLAGLFSGLALAVKHQTAAMGLIPLGLVLLTGGRDALTNGTATDLKRALGRSVRDTFIWGGTALLVFALFMLPPILTNPSATYYALVTMPQRLVFLGGGGLRWAKELLLLILPADQAQPILSVLQAQLSFLPLLMVLLAVGAIVAVNLRRRQPIGIADPRLIGLLALGPLIFIITNKWVDEHYYQVPLALLFLWDLISVTPRQSEVKSDYRPWPVLGLVAMLMYIALTSISGESFNGADPGRQDWYGLFLNFVFFIILTVVVTTRLVSRQPSDAEVAG